MHSVEDDYTFSTKILPEVCRLPVLLQPALERWEMEAWRNQKAGHRELEIPHKESRINTVLLLSLSWANVVFITQASAFLKKVTARFLFPFTSNLGHAHLF